MRRVAPTRSPPPLAGVRVTVTGQFREVGGGGGGEVLLAQEKAAVCFGDACAGDGDEEAAVDLRAGVSVLRQ